MTLGDKRKKNIVLLYGGIGAEHSVSVKSKRNLEKHFDREKYNLFPVKIEKDGHFTMDFEEEKTFPCLIDGECGFLMGNEVLKCDCVFPLLHGDYGEDGVVQGLLESVKIPYVGNSVEVGALCADKHLTKLLANSGKIDTVSGFAVNSTEKTEDVLKKAKEKIGFPLFIKPNNLGSSIGASAVMEDGDFASAFSTAKECSNSKILIEKYIENKREIECGFFESRGKRYFPSPSEIKSCGFYTYEKKYSENQGVELVEVADLPPEIETSLIEKCRAIVDLFRLRDLARIDFFLCGDKIFLNEINTMPGFTDGSLFPNMLNRCGFSLDRAVDALIENAIARK